MNTNVKDLPVINLSQQQFLSWLKLHGDVTVGVLSGPSYKNVFTKFLEDHPKELYKATGNAVKNPDIKNPEWMITLQDLCDSSKDSRMYQMLMGNNTLSVLKELGYLND